MRMKIAMPVRNCIIRVVTMLPDILPGSAASRGNGGGKTESSSREDNLGEIALSLSRLLISTRSQLEQTTALAAAVRRYSVCCGCVPPPSPRPSPLGAYRRPIRPAAPSRASCPRRPTATPRRVSANAYKREDEALKSRL
jgi:hypothetical protein